jgi:hypothetical protein
MMADLPPRIRKAVDEAVAAAARDVAARACDPVTFARMSLAYRLGELGQLTRHEFGTDPCLKRRPFLKEAMIEVSAEAEDLIRTGIRNELLGIGGID